MQIKRQTNKNLGFTLIELMIAITILSMLLTMVYTILLSTLNARKFVDEQTEIDRVGTQIMAMLTRDLQAVYMYQLEVCFRGEDNKKRDRIDFISNTDSLIYMDREASDLSEISYFLMPNKDESGAFKLIRREDFFIDDKPFAGGIGVVLYDRIASFDLSFYDDRGSAKKSWDNKLDKAVPAAIEVKLGVIATPREEEFDRDEVDIREFRTIIRVLVSSKAPPPPEKSKKNKETTPPPKQDEDNN